MSDDDQAWMEAVAGRPAAGLDRRSQQEVRALREVALEKSRAAPADEMATQAGLRLLLSRLEREGLLSRRQEYRGLRWRWAFAAAAVLVVGVGLVTQYPSLLTGPGPAYDEPPQYRGAPERRTVRAADARGYVESLQREIAAGGGGARIYQRGQVYYLELSLAADTPEPVRQALRKRSINDAPVGVMLIEVKTGGS